MGCEKNNEPCPSNFIVYGEVIPYAETYKVGDTITLQAFYHYMIYEKETKEFYDMTDVHIELGLSIHRFDITNLDLDDDLIELVDLIPNSNYSTHLQYFSNGGSKLFSSIILDIDTFKNELKIVLKKKGLYMLVYGPFSLENNQDFEGKCRNSTFNLFSRLNEGMDNNIDLLKESPDEHFNKWTLEKPIQRFYRGGFAYRVID